ncbi:GNAT family N-acetyltransferase [uncultured Acetobacteroides sp.]|uniref:GNAT family N-acetyltransferase n=1 Tax=uncultured Acetobacteroides sp. TaxID=1760811 RepID=UPI0029F50C08|nr:GNAT family N-acetyltransferase [uncultured Acetobacteroides sp.]
MIRQSKKRDAAKLMAVVKAASSAMLAKGIDQWDEIYPNSDVLKDDIGKGELFVLEENGAIKGMVVLNEFQDKEYADVCWALTEGRQLVVHRLCVHPDYQGVGVGKRLMAFAEDYAQRNGYSSIRLDCFTQNPASVALYERLGYAKAGTVTFRKGVFYCFEKAISSNP